MTDYKKEVADGKIAEHGGAANMFESLLDIGAIRLVEQEINQTKKHA